MAERFLGKRDFHQLIQRNERNHYNVMVADSKRCCDRVTMLCVDQSKPIFIPRLRPPLGGLTRKHRLEVRAGGGIAFSFDNTKYLFLSLASWSTTADVVITQLFEMISATVTADHAACRSRHLHIHADNAGKENKNQYIFAFLGWLLLLRWYDTAELSFLVVGHTANEDDSLVFSPMHKHASFESIMTLFDLIMKIQQSLGTQSEVCIIESLYNWREFFVHALPGIKGHMQARHFLFELDRDGNPIVRAREYAGLSTKWGEPIRCLNKRGFFDDDGNPCRTPQPFANDLNPVFPQVREGLELCLRVASFQEPEREFVRQLLAVPSLSKQAEGLPRPPLQFNSGSEFRDDGKVGVRGFVIKGGASLCVRVVDASSPPPLILPQAIIERRSQLSIRDTEIKKRIDELAMDPKGGAVKLKQDKGAARRHQHPKNVAKLQGGITAESNKRSQSHRGWHSEERKREQEKRTARKKATRTRRMTSRSAKNLKKRVDVTPGPAASASSDEETESDAPPAAADLGKGADPNWLMDAEPAAEPVHEESASDELEEDLDVSDDNGEADAKDLLRIGANGDNDDDHEWTPRNEAPQEEKTVGVGRCISGRLRRHEHVSYEEPQSDVDDIVEHEGPSDHHGAEDNREAAAASEEDPQAFEARANARMRELRENMKKSAKKRQEDKRKAALMEAHGQQQLAAKLQKRSRAMRARSNRL